MLDEAAYMFFVKWTTIPGGWVGEKKTKLMLYSTLVKLKLKLELSLAKTSKQTGAELGLRFAKLRPA